MHQETPEGQEGYPQIKAAPVSLQLTLCLWYNTNTEVRSDSPPQNHLCHALRHSLQRSQKTPGPLQPDQSVQISLVLDKQHSYPCCQVHHSGLRVLFEKCSCPEKIFTQQRVGCTAPQPSTFSATRLRLSLIDQLLSVAFVPHLTSAWKQNLEPNN